MTVETNETATGRKGRPKKPPYDVSTAQDADGNAVPLEDGRLTAIPLNWSASDAALKRAYFHPPTGTKGKLLFWSALAHCEDRISEMHAAKAEAHREKVENNGIVDPVKRADKSIKSALKALAVNPLTMTGDEALALILKAANS